MIQVGRGYTLVPDRASSAFTHHVQSGDTFFSIADKYVVSFDDLLRANEHRHLDLLALRRGQVLDIPVHHKPRSAYTVRQGDDLWRIAQLTGVPVSMIEADNPHAVSLTPGTCLFIRTYPSYQIEFKDGQMHSNPDLPQHWVQDAHFSKVLAMQHELLKPQGKAIFKFPSIEAPELECFVEVH